jgi:hypothetical protein
VGLHRSYFRDSPVSVSTMWTLSVGLIENRAFASFPEPVVFYNSGGGGGEVRKGGETAEILLTRSIRFHL